MCEDIPIGIINVDFQILDERAVVDNLIDITSPDSLLIDVPNRPRSPYLTKTVLVASPLLKETHSKTVTFETNGIYNMQAATKTISTVEVDFRNGQGYQTLPTNGIKTVTYTFTGLKHLKFKITFSDNSVQYTYARLKVNASNPTLSENNLQNRVFNCNAGILYASRKFQGYNETKAYSGAGEYQIVQGGNSLDKPVIVVDGFDPFQGTDFGTDINSIYGFLNQEGLANDLRFNSGFDIIPLNFIKYKATDGTIINGGTDYVERNAMVLVELIEQINQCKEGNEPIKLVGFSMGGLVARYALAYMEQNNIPHDTDLFVSVDAPHKGAVVPIGFQETVDLLDDLRIYRDPDVILKSPAARQLLVHHYLANSKPPEGAPNFHDRFYNDLNALGFPQQTRNIAVVNGVATGTAINSSGQIYADAELETWLLFPIGVRTKAKLMYTPNRGQTADALNFKLQLKLLIIRITIFKRIRQATTLTALGSYENTPGGFYNIEKLTRDFLGMDNEFNPLDDDLLEALVLEIKAKLNNANFSFIPVKSSLAYSGSNQDLYEDFSGRDLVCDGDTPFDSYFTSTTGNQEHIKLIYNSANYIEQEIKGNEQLPNVDLQNADLLLGPDLVCNSNTTYQFDNCNDLPVTWQVSSNLQIVSSTNSNIIVKSINGSTNGAGFIKATYRGQTFTKNIWIGKPSFTVTETPSLNYVDLNIIGTNGATIGEQGITNSTWQVTRSTFGGGLSGAPTPFYRKASGQGYDWAIDITVTATNACGTTTKSFYNITPPAPDPCGPERIDYAFMTNDNGGYILNPDPDPCDEERASTNQMLNNTDVRVYDFTGNRVMTHKRIIDLSNLSPGIYILKATINGEVVTKKVIK